MFGRRLVVAVLSAVLLVAASASAAIGAKPAWSPGQVLISETSGVLWSYDIGTGEVSEFATVNNGNFDIQFLGPQALLIGNINSFVSQLDLRSFQETLVSDSDLLTSPIGLAASPREGGVYYFADPMLDESEVGGVFAFDPRSGELDLLVEIGANDVAVDNSGLVYFTDGSRLGRFDPTQEPIQVEEVAVIENTNLNGLVVTPTGQVFVVSTGTPEGDPVGVYQVDTDTGKATPIHEGAPLRNPEDVAFAPNGDLYIIDSAFLQPPENFVPGLYRMPRGGGDIETLHTGEPFGDVVDILVTPFTGF